MTKLEEKLGRLKASREALTNLLKLKMKDMSFKEIDYVNELNEKLLVAIDFVEKLLEIEKIAKNYEKETMNYGKEN